MIIKGNFIKCLIKIYKDRTSVMCKFCALFLLKNAESNDRP